MIIYLPLVKREDLPVTKAYPLVTAYALIAVVIAALKLYIPSGGSTSSGILVEA